MGQQEELNPHHDSSAYSINITLNSPKYRLYWWWN